MAESREQVNDQDVKEPQEAEANNVNPQQSVVAVVENSEGVVGEVGAGDEEPPAKKTKVADTSAVKAGSVGTKSEKDNFPYARLRGIRIFSEREINAQDAAMTREYWNFWNRTAEELCSDRAYNEWGKRDLKLFIDAAWVAHKTQLQEVQERGMQEIIRDLQERYGQKELPAKLKTEDENVTELLAQLQDSTANLVELNMDLAKARGKFLNVKQRPTSTSYTQELKNEEVQEMTMAIVEKEKNLYDGMADVKKDQDSLKKALSRLNNLVKKAEKNCPELPIILNPPIATIETTIIHQM